MVEDVRPVPPPFRVVAKPIPGANKMILNAATVVEALQEYFDNRTKVPLFEVKGVVRGSDGNNTFEVSISEPEEKV